MFNMKGVGRDPYLYVIMIQSWSRIALKLDLSFSGSLKEGWEIWRLHSCAVFKALWLDFTGVLSLPVFFPELLWLDSTQGYAEPHVYGA